MIVDSTLAIQQLDYELEISMRLYLMNQLSPHSYRFKLFLYKRVCTATVNLHQQFTHHIMTCFPCPR